jgi:uncharacterized protein
MRKFNFVEIKAYIDAQSEASKIYIGCDSVSYKRNGTWYADFYKVVVVHIDGCHGCKIFGEIQTEVDYNHNKKKPSYRLMNECYKVAELYLTLADLTGRDIEVHLDLNPKKKYASNLIVEQAIGYIKGTCNVVPLVKPNAFAASYAADRLLRVRA